MQEEAILQGLQHKKIGWGIEEKPGSLYRHNSKSTVGLLLLFFKNHVLRARSQS